MAESDRTGLYLSPVVVTLFPDSRKMIDRNTARNYSATAQRVIHNIMQQQIQRMGVG